MPPSPKDPDQDGKGKVIPFPGASRPGPDENPLAGLPVDPDSQGIGEAWSGELSQLKDEPQTAPLTLILDPKSGRALLEFLENTGLMDLVKVRIFEKSLLIDSTRPTVNRLIAWQALDLGLSFTAKTGD